MPCTHIAPTTSVGSQQQAHTPPALSTPPPRQVPFFFKHAVDSLSIDPTGLTTSPYLGLLHLGPLALLTGYGISRIGASFCGELRNVVFAKVSQSAIRRVANQVFGHLHNLDLHFHLSRQTGGGSGDWVCRCLESWGGRKM